MLLLPWVTHPSRLNLKVCNSWSVHTDRTSTFSLLRHNLWHLDLFGVLLYFQKEKVMVNIKFARLLQRIPAKTWVSFQHGQHTGGLKQATVAFSVRPCPLSHWLKVACHWALQGNGCQTARGENLVWDGSDCVDFFVPH